jgi:phosphoglycerol transferase MdoB-like AlkP superfamily enzyme
VARRKGGLFLGLERVFISGAIFFLLLFAAIEIVFWIEFQSRLNFIAVDYLIYTTEVIGNIWESYPMVWILSSLLLLSVFLGNILFKRFGHADERLFTKHTLVFSILLAFLAPALSARYVSIDLMHQHGNSFVEELSGNGLFTLLSALRHNELDYEKFYATIPQEKANEILKTLGVEWTSDLERRMDRWGDDSPNEKLPGFIKRRPRNVVMITVESLSAKFLGAYGSTEGLTPNLDNLSKQSLFFANVFATGTRTVRGLEALTLSTPPIPGQAIIRRPKNARLASIGGMLREQGFNVLFFYGGYAYFDNMKPFFNSNGYDVVDRGTFSPEQITFKNAWGVCDEDIFNKTLTSLDEASRVKKRFFAQIMTVSNHRPYTYPDGRIDIKSPGRRRGAVKYTDFAIGQFLEKAKSHKWFNDTLFVIVADHCASVSGRTELPVADYRIPLMFYGPNIVKPGRWESNISQIDVPPTLMDVLGVAGDDLFFGKEIQEQTVPRAFISTYQNLGYYRNNQLVVLKPKRIIETFEINPITWESTSVTADPKLVNEAIAYYQTASVAYRKGQLKLEWK